MMKCHSDVVNVHNTVTNLSKHLKIKLLTKNLSNITMHSPCIDILSPKDNTRKSVFSTYVLSYSQTSKISIGALLFANFNLIDRKLEVVLILSLFFNLYNQILGGWYKEIMINSTKPDIEYNRN